uniref:tRNA_int_endo domain-containing protein n=1 Tax=Steinernema glaseri TaxID=37863 RepID=A0A1I8AE86_9BILA
MATHQKQEDPEANIRFPSESLILATDGYNPLLKVIQPKTKFLETMGTYRNRCHWIYPLEAVYLLNTNNAIIMHNNVPMTRQEARYLLEQHNIPWFSYVVYKLLKDRGYCIRVVRNVYFDIYTPEGYTIQSEDILPKHKVICCGCEELGRASDLQCADLNLFTRLAWDWRQPSTILALTRNGRVTFYTVSNGDIETIEV